jgi:hypothetical protein
MPEFHPDTISAVQELVARYPSTPFLTLGQTVLWDEPLKAAFCRILEGVAPGAPMVGAVHDTDYFAKLPYLENRAEKYVILPHNDGDTRGLWSAAGELSCLFGSETVPTRQALTENGVAVDRVARSYPGGLDALLNEETEAWGWRALVQTEHRPLIAADVKLRDIGPALKQQLEWGFTESLKIVQAQSSNAVTNESAECPCPTPCGPREVAARISGWVDEYLQLDPDGTLSDLYRWLTPRLWAMVRGTGSCNLESNHSLRLFRFNRETASLPRFRFVDLFLQPHTRTLARQCYDDAVRGSGIYNLDQFGPGALPFDVVIPGRGRGTLRQHEGSLYIETEEPITVCMGCNCGSVGELADALEAQFGDNVALVGKAVALISMLAHEFIFVFHEKASGYTERTQQMNAALRAGGVDLELHPMLRLKYATWNALQNVEATLTLPPHLAGAFGNETITASEFAERWEQVCDEQDAWRESLKACRSPRELMTLLATRENGDGQWSGKLAEYSEARKTVKMVRERTSVLEQEVTQLREQARVATESAEALQRAKGEDFRATVQPLRTRLFDIKEAAAQRLNPVDEQDKPRRLTKEERAAEAQLAEQEAQEVAQLESQIAQRQQQRQHFNTEIDELLRQAREAKNAAKVRVAERVELERSPQTAAARETTGRLEYEAELERLRGVRSAILVSKGLRYTNYRPTAWWLPLVSPDGRWFDALTQTAVARIEEI